MLEKSRHDVVEAENGEEGLNMLEKNKPYFVLLDVMMPELKGWEVCEKIKADNKHKHLPVVMFTIRRCAESVKRSYECGADGHISKPFDVKELLDTVEDLLGKPRR